MESNNAKCIDELRSIKDSIECCLLQQIRTGDVDIDALETWCKAVVRRINAALSAPARNCDRFGGDKDRLIEACMRERGLLVTENFHEVFHHWLFAPAAERKGEGE